jgi:hypothetical protein
MAGIVLAGPSQLYVQWSCRRCGHRGGIAKTTVPVGREWNEPMMRHLFDSLRQKLVRVHLRQGCVAVVDDFEIAAFVPHGKTLLDRI